MPGSRRLGRREPAGSTDDAAPVVLGLALLAAVGADAVGVELGGRVQFYLDADFVRMTGDLEVLDCTAADGIRLPRLAFIVAREAL